MSGENDEQKVLDVLSVLDFIQMIFAIPVVILILICVLR